MKQAQVTFTDFLVAATLWFAAEAVSFDKAGWLASIGTECCTPQQQGLVLSLADSHRNLQNTKVLIYINNITTRWWDIHISLSQAFQERFPENLIPGGF